MSDVLSPADEIEKKRLFRAYELAIKGGATANAERLKKLISAKKKRLLTHGEAEKLNSLKVVSQGDALDLILKEIIPFAQRTKDVETIDFIAKCVFDTKFIKRFDWTIRNSIKVLIELVISSKVKSKKFNALIVKVADEHGLTYPIYMHFLKDYCIYLRRSSNKLLAGEKLLVNRLNHIGLVNYASEVIKGVWPQAEGKIIEDPFSAALYARICMGRRWLEAEYTIFQHDHSSLEYLFFFGLSMQEAIDSNPELKRRLDRDDTIIEDQDIISGIVLENENELTDHPDPSTFGDLGDLYRYILIVINKHQNLGIRWPEAEPYLLQHAGYACSYVTDVINRGVKENAVRWLEAEHVIFRGIGWELEENEYGDMSEDYFKYEYLDFFGMTEQEAIDTNPELKWRQERDDTIIESLGYKDDLLVENEKDEEAYARPDPTGWTAEECAKFLIARPYDKTKARLSQYRWREAEPIIMKDPEWAFRYTVYVINNDSNLGIRWLEAEPYIAKHQRWASRYAIEVLNKSDNLGIRWPLAEPVIKTDPENAYYYAKNVIDYKGEGKRWLEAEPYIMTDADYAFKYTYYIINLVTGTDKIRWPEAEPYIMQNPRTAFYYAKHFIKGKRWPEAEYYLFAQEDESGADYLNRYLNAIGMTEQEAIDTNQELKRRLDRDDTFIEDQVDQNGLMLEDQGEVILDPSLMEQKELYFNVLKAIKDTDLLDMDWDHFVEYYPNHSTNSLYYDILNAVDKGKETGQRWYDAEPFIMYDAKLACYYTIDIINKGQRLGIRWPEAEPYIMKNSGTAFNYMVHVINGGPASLGKRMVRWPEAEYYILNNNGDSDSSYKNGYLTFFGMTEQEAIDTNPELKRRLDRDDTIIEDQVDQNGSILEDEGEDLPDANSMEPKELYYHVIKALKNRKELGIQWSWFDKVYPEAATQWIYHYLLKTMGKGRISGRRWYEAEAIIKHDAELALNYTIEIINKGKNQGIRWPEAEPYIMQNPRTAFRYSIYFIKGIRWPEAEYYLITQDENDVDYKNRYLEVIGMTEREAIDTNPELRRRLERDDIIIEGESDDDILLESRNFSDLDLEKLTPVQCYRYAEEYQSRWKEAEPKILTAQPLILYSYAKNVIWRFDTDNPEYDNGRWPEAEEKISSDPDAAYLYARHILLERWPIAEELISGDPILAYNYARDVIKPFDRKNPEYDGGRWPEAEPIIMLDPFSASSYAKNIIKKRWKEAEFNIMLDSASARYYERFLNMTNDEIISTNPSLVHLKEIERRRSEREDEIIESQRSDDDLMLEARPSRLPDPSKMTPLECYYYTEQAINKGKPTQIRWREAEPYIMVDPISAFLYTRDILNNPDDPQGIRWPEAEPYIMVEPEIAFDYVNEVMNPDYYNPQGIRWPEAEPYIMQRPREAYSYAVIIINRGKNLGIRWPEGEYAIFQNEDFIIQRYLDAACTTKQEVIDTNPDLRRRLERDDTIIESQNVDGEDFLLEFVGDEGEHDGTPDPSIMSLEDIMQFVYKRLNDKRKNFLGTRWPEAEPYIMKDPTSAFFYTRDVINRTKDLGIRWPDAEPYIMVDPVWAMHYTQEILNKRRHLGIRWPEAEPFIMEDSRSACDYACDVINRGVKKNAVRWLQAEYTILTRDQTTDEIDEDGWYGSSQKQEYLEFFNITEQEAIDTNPELRRRLERDDIVIESEENLGELILESEGYPKKPDPATMSYEEMVMYFSWGINRRITIGVRWPEAEPYIVKDPAMASWYAYNVINMRESGLGIRWYEAEPYIATDPTFAFEYAWQIINKRKRLGIRWPEAEYAIFQNDDRKINRYLDFANTTAEEVYNTNQEFRRKTDRDNDIIESKQPSGLPDYNKMSSFECYSYAKNTIEGRWKAAEDKILANRYWAYAYASDVIQEGWPRAEPIIMQDPELAVSYVENALKRRWPEAEYSIFQDEGSKILYLKYISMTEQEAVRTNPMLKTILEDDKQLLENRYESGDERLVQVNLPDPATLEPRECIFHADWLQGRWKDAEWKILEDPMAAVRYARNIIKKHDKKAPDYDNGRWPEAEEIIKTDPEAIWTYADHVIQRRWEEAEPYLVTSPRYAWLYVMKVLGKRWLEAEYYIFQKEDTKRYYLNMFHITEQDAIDTNPGLKKKLESDLDVIENRGVSGQTIQEAYDRSYDPRDLTPEECFQVARGDRNGRWRDAEWKIMTSPWVSWLYARFVIEERWLEAEYSILDDAKARPFYLGWLDMTEQQLIDTNPILKRRLESDVEVIESSNVGGRMIGEENDRLNPDPELLSPSQCIHYLRAYDRNGDQIVTCDADGRWREAEWKIMESPISSWYYAKHVIKGRWYEAEYTLLANDDARKEYLGWLGMTEEELIDTNPILKRRLIDDDNVVIENRDYKNGNPEFLSPYECFLFSNGSRWKEAEWKILTSPWDAYLYAKYVVKGRWLEAEYNILSDEETATIYLKFVGMTEQELILTNPELKRLVDRDNEIIENDEIDGNVMFENVWPIPDPSKMTPQEIYNHAVTVRNGKRWPEAEPIIKESPYWAVHYAIDIINSGKELGIRWPEAEPYIMMDPSCAYQYTLEVINGLDNYGGIRWPEAEPYIAEDPESATDYSRYIINKNRNLGIRWDEAEPYIMKEPYLAYLYAVDTLNGRWLEAEPYIYRDEVVLSNYLEIFGLSEVDMINTNPDVKRMADRDDEIIESIDHIEDLLNEGQAKERPDPSTMTPMECYEYTRDVISTRLIDGAIRWPEAEPYIMRDPETAVFYTKNIINKGQHLGVRWPEAEPYIMEHYKAAYEYVEWVINQHKPYGKRWPEAEAFLKESPYWAYNYAFHIINKHKFLGIRWPEAEPYIAQSPEWAYKYARDIINRDKKTSDRWLEAEFFICKDNYWFERYLSMIRMTEQEAIDTNEEIEISKEVERRKLAREDEIIESQGYQNDDLLSEAEEDRPDPSTMTPEDCYIYTCNVINASRSSKKTRMRRWPDAEPYIMQDPWISCLYAAEIIKGRWQEAECSIFRDDHYSKWYANSFLGVTEQELIDSNPELKRMLDSEDAIIEDHGRDGDLLLEDDDNRPDPNTMTPQECFNFVHGKINHRKPLGIRWPEAEPIIMKEPKYALKYAILVINKGIEYPSRWQEKFPERIGKNIRWLEAEPYIIVVPQTAYEYAYYIIEDRWPEAEPYLLKDLRYALGYAVHVLEERWPELEELIIDKPELAVRYASNAIKSRWFDAEPFILTSGCSTLDYLLSVIHKGKYGKAQSDIKRQRKQDFKKRWLEAEYTFLNGRNEDSLGLYLKFVGYTEQELIDSNPELKRKLERDYDIIENDNSEGILLLEDDDNRPDPNKMSPQACYIYVNDIINQGESLGIRWPEAEPIIMKSPEYATMYTIIILNKGDLNKDHVLKKRSPQNMSKIRWPEAEPCIMRHPRSAFNYAYFIIEDRWPEAEPFIMTNLSCVIEYAIKVINGRWQEAEPLILTSSDRTLDYLLNVIYKGRYGRSSYKNDIRRNKEKSFKRRWLEAEYYLCSNDDKESLNSYLRFVGYTLQELIDTNPMLKRKLDRDDEIIESQDIDGDLLLEDEDNHPDPSTMTPEECYIYAYDDINKRKRLGIRWPEAEPIILKDPEWSFYYTEKIINKGKKLGIRWPEAEPNILEDPKWATVYAEEIIQDRWPAAESMISSIPYWALRYAINTIKGRWPTAEPLLLSDAEHAMQYLRYVINRRKSDKKYYGRLFHWDFELNKKKREKGSWKRLLEAEASIYKNDRLWEIYKTYVGHTEQELINSNPELKREIDRDNEIIESEGIDRELILEARNSDPDTMTPQQCYEYAYDVINHTRRLGIRWREGEHVIKRDPEMAYLYTSVIINRCEEGSGKRWRAAEPIIMQDPFVAYCYAGDVINRRQFLGIRWPEAEPIIATDANAAEKYARYVINKDQILGIRWPEAEPTIMSDADRAYRYARYSMGGRWPEAEYYILDYDQYGRSYLEFLGMTEQELIDTNPELKSKLERDYDVIESIDDRSDLDMIKDIKTRGQGIL